MDITTTRRAALADLASIDRADPLFLKQITARCVLLAGRERDFLEFKMYAWRALCGGKTVAGSNFGTILSRTDIKQSQNCLVIPDLIRDPESFGFRLEPAPEGWNPGPE